MIPRAAFAAIAILGLFVASVDRLMAYPVKPVRIIVHSAAGAGPDIIGRIIAERLSTLWGQQVVVLNHPGAGGLIGARQAAAAEPDGYTLFLPTNTTYVVLPEQHQQLPFDLDRAFAPIGFVAETPMMVATAPTLGVASLPELVAKSKEQPGQLFFSAGSRGSLPHLAGELIRKETGADLTFVPYQGDAAALPDLISGRIAAMVSVASALAGAARGASIRPVALTSTQRLPSFPDVATASESHPGLVATAWFLLVAPSGVPDVIVSQINRDLNTVLGQAELNQKFGEVGALVRTMSPGETAAFIRTEQQTWRPVARALGLRQ